MFTSYLIVIIPWREPLKDSKFYCRLTYRAAPLMSGVDTVYFKSPKVSKYFLGPLYKTTCDFNASMQIIIVNDYVELFIITDI